MLQSILMDPSGILLAVILSPFDLDLSQSGNSQSSPRAVGSTGMFPSKGNLLLRLTLLKCLRQSNLVDPSWTTVRHILCSAFALSQPGHSQILSRDRRGFICRSRFFLVLV
jgi:hypothetical protein